MAGGLGEVHPRELGARGDPELAKDVAQVEIDGPRAEEEPPRDGAIGVALGDELLGACLEVPLSVGIREPAERDARLDLDDERSPGFATLNRRPIGFSSAARRTEPSRFSSSGPIVNSCSTSRA